MDTADITERHIHYSRLLKAASRVCRYLRKGDCTPHGIRTKAAGAESALSQEQTALIELEKALEGSKRLQRDKAQQLFANLCVQSPQLGEIYLQADETPAEVLRDTFSRIEADGQEQFNAFLAALAQNARKQSENRS